ncbi:hypothetical protein CPB97_010634, partial [Podila verticillata]
MGGADEIVSQVSRPLAEINVSILQISTYDADFTLLPECDLERSLECLSKTFKISNNPLGDAGLQAGELQSWEATYPATPGGVNSLQEALLHSSTYTSRGRQFSIKTDQFEGDFYQGDSGIASEVHSGPNSGPNSGLVSGHGSHVIDQGLEASLMASLSLKDDIDDSTSSVTHTEFMHPFKANFTHKLRITSMEPSLMDQLAVRLLESIFFDT